MVKESGGTFWQDYEITDEYLDGEEGNFRIIKNKDGDTYDYIQIEFPELGDRTLRIEFMGDGKKFNIYTTDFKLKKKDFSFSRLDLVVEKK